MKRVTVLVAVVMVVVAVLAALLVVRPWTPQPVEPAPGLSAVSTSLATRSPLKSHGKSGQKSSLTPPPWCQGPGVECPATPPKGWKKGTAKGERKDCDKTCQAIMRNPQALTPQTVTPAELTWLIHHQWLILGTTATVSKPDGKVSVCTVTMTNWCGLSFTDTWS